MWASLLGQLPKNIMYVLIGRNVVSSLTEIIQVRIYSPHFPSCLTPQGKMKADAGHIVPLVAQIVVFLALLLSLGYYGKKALNDIRNERMFHHVLFILF
jgi:uncharacterized membrane protein YdjX (TVP38/TMEM64 family)